MAWDEEDDTAIYRVVVNHEEQYTVWYADQPVPRGYRDAGFKGTRKECLTRIEEVWTDMRPLSVRRLFEQLDRRR